jgi:hypothetical protein
MTPEGKLWAAVLNRAVEDALSSLPTRPEMKLRQTHREYRTLYRSWRHRRGSLETNRDSARNFLAFGGEAFRTICYGAGLNPYMIREEADKLKKNFWKVDATNKGALSRKRRQDIQSDIDAILRREQT